MIQLPNFNTIKDIKKITFIDKGWSLEKKYLLETDTFEKYVLRVSNIEYLSDKEEEFEIIKQFYNLDINMSKPIEITKDKEYVYLLLKWVEGNPLDEIIRSIDQKKQYSIGLESGKILQRIHSIKAPNSITPWYERYSKKTHKLIKKYHECPIKFKQDQVFIDFLKDNLSILKDRPQTLQHGDYHVGNQILTPKEDVSIIDFNRWDYGDPWEEFKGSFIFSKEQSIPYAVGQIDGYFNNQVPKDFFLATAFYTVRNTISSIPWTLIYGKSEKEMEDNFKRIDKLYHDYNGFKSFEPKWYTNFHRIR